MSSNAADTVQLHLNLLPFSARKLYVNYLLTYFSKGQFNYSVYFCVRASTNCRIVQVASWYPIYVLFPVHMCVNLVMHTVHVKGADVSPIVTEDTGVSS